MRYKVFVMRPSPQSEDGWYADPFCETTSGTVMKAAVEEAESTTPSNMLVVVLDGNELRRVIKGKK